MQNKERAREIMEIDLRKLLAEYLRKWWIIAICTVVAAAATLIYLVNCVTPVYRAGVTVYVNNVREDQDIQYISGSNLTAAQQLVTTYMKILTSDAVLEHAIREGDLEFTADQLRSMISTSQAQDTMIFNIYVAHADPQTAADVVNALAGTSLDVIEELVRGSAANVIDYARVPEGIHAPNYVRNTVLAGILGALAVMGILGLRCLLDMRVKTAEDLEQVFNIPVLGNIPAFLPADRADEKGFTKLIGRKGRLEQ